MIDWAVEIVDEKLKEFLSINHNSGVPVRFIFCAKKDLVSGGLYMVYFILRKGTLNRYLVTVSELVDGKLWECGPVEWLHECEMFAPIATIKERLSSFAFIAVLAIKEVQ